MKITLCDRIHFRITKREMTDEGFLRVPGNVARSGIQEYLASELGISDGDPNRMVNVFRPENEVFNADSLATYAGKDVTDNHPDEFVNSKNYKELTVGHVAGLARKEGDFVVADLIIKDSDTIDKINDGKVELSAGYTAEYIEEKGTTSDGIPYEFVQRNITVNHVALVDAARAGSQARIFDKQEVHKMPKIVTLDNGRTVEVADSASAALIQDHFDRINKKAEDGLVNLNKVKADLEKAHATIDSLKEEKKDLETKTSDKAIEKRVLSMAKLFSDSKKMVKDFDPSGKTEDQIKLAILSELKPDRKFKDKSKDYVNAAFDICLDQAEEEEKKEAEDQEEEEEDQKNSEDSLKKFAKDVSDSNKSKKPEIKGREARDQKVSESWRKTVGDK